MEVHPKHPKGTQARVLLASVFGPYAQDDEFGSRKINPMELYHNQVTRAQGSFSLRMFHRSWGIMMIQENISAPTTVLDFPTLEIFENELRASKSVVDPTPNTCELAAGYTTICCPSLPAADTSTTCCECA